MYDVTAVQDSFLTLNGWRDTPDTDYPRLGASIKVSDSGKYYNDVAGHPLVTIENVDAVAPDFDNYPASDWLIATAYLAGAWVRRGKTVYEAIQNSTGKDPLTEVTYWKTLLSSYIENLTRASVDRVVSTIMTNKRLNHGTKALLNSVLLFDGTANVTDRIIRQGRFVGFEITMKNYKSMRARVDQIGLQITHAGTFTVYLFHSSQQTAIKTKEVTTTKPNSMEWFTLSQFDLYTHAATTDGGGRYYLGYFENDLPGQALQKKVDLYGGTLCSTCLTGRYNFEAYRAYSKYLTIRPVSIENSALDGVNLPSLDSPGYETNQNYGLNAFITVQCDFTGLLIQNRLLLAEVLKRHVMVDVLRLIAFSTRSDANLERIRPLAMMELKSEFKDSGMEAQLERELKAIDLDTSGHDSPCLNTPGSGIKMGAI